MRIRIPGALVASAAALAAAGALTLPEPRDAAAAPAGKSARRVPPLRVQKLKPRHRAKFVDLDAELSITFNRAIDPSSVDERSVVVRPLGSLVPVEWSSRLEASNRRVVIVPRQPLNPGADYEMVVSRGIADAEGRYLARERRVLFFTDPRFSAHPLLRPEQFEDLDARMSERRAAHSATLVAGGRVLLAGGMRDQFALAAGADVYDPAYRTFRIAASLLRTPRAYHPAVPVGAGSALLLGGWDGAGATATTEFYDRVVGDLVPGPVMGEARDFHAAVVLDDGRVLVTGGGSYGPDGSFARSSVAEILDFDFRWRPTQGAPLRRRAGHTLTRLADGTVLVAGGQTSLSGQSAAFEIFDPKTETFRFVTNAPNDHRQLHSATPIDGGTRVLLADGANPIVEVYDPATERFFPAGGASFIRRSRATATELPWGDVILAGGFNSDSGGTVALSTIDLYVRSEGGWGKVYATGVAFREPRAGHTATSLEDGRVLFAGGFTNGDSLDSAVLFTPEPPGSTK